MLRLLAPLATLCLLGVLHGCESDDPTATPLNTAGASGQAGSGPAAGVCEADKGLTVTDNTACQPRPDDYQPRTSGSADDTWAPCISDDNVYHPFNASVGSNARTEAFERMAVLLGFGGSRAPTPEDFLQAKVEYSIEEGLQSRVARREDVHYPPAPKQCRDLSADELKMYPDRCVSQSKIQPLVETALNDGAMGKDPARNAARVEAGLLWFFYVSIYKEIETCGSEDKEDCDSATGYYAGVQTRDQPLGLARYIKALSPQAHDRVWDGLLAARCWRDQDTETPSTDDATRLRAMNQTDRAALRGLSLLVRTRLANAASCGVAHESGVILGRVLLREARARNATLAATLEAELDKPATELNAATVTDALQTLFDCP